MTFVDKARECDNCLCWLEYCGAECCSQFHFPTNRSSDVTVEADIVKIRIPMTKDRKWYFELHGVEMADDMLLISKRHCRFLPELISVYMRCSFLADKNLCSGHPADKPDICKNVTLENAKEGKCDLTPNCLFGYKLGINTQ